MNHPELLKFLCDLIIAYNKKNITDRFCQYDLYGGFTLSDETTNNYLSRETVNSQDIVMTFLDYETP